MTNDAPKIIEIIVAPDGQTRLETKGFTGSACREASRLMEQAIGKTVSERLTADFHRTSADHTNHLHEEK